VAAFRARTPDMAAADIRRAWIAQTPLGWVEHRAAWSPTGEIGRWVIANPAVVLIDGTLFVHAGLGAAWAQRPPAEINAAVAAALAARDDRASAIINDPLGPLWYRGLVSRDAQAAMLDAPTGAAPATPAAATSAAAAPALTPEDELDLVLKAQGAQRMVVGHTPILSGIALLHGGRLAQIDTGISAAYGGRLSWLEIRDGALSAHHIDRPATADAP
jgi:hypothetical protein